MRKLILLSILILFICNSYGKIKCNLCHEEVRKYLIYTMNSEKINICSDCNDNAKSCGVCKSKIIDKNSSKYKDGRICSYCKSHLGKCSKCKDYLTGQYYNLKKSKLCVKCYEEKEFCDVCGNFKRELHKIKDRVICSKCIKAYKKCSFCEKHIVGNYTIQNGKNICKSCADLVQQCDICKVYDQNLVYERTDKFCKSCYKDIKRCKVCENVIKGRYWKINEKHFCNSCNQEHRKCDICYEPFDGKKYKLKDGRIFCRSCRKTAILKRNKKAKKIEKLVKKFLKKDLNIHLYEKYRVKIVNKDTLTRISKNEKAIGFYKGNGKKRTIYLLRGLPKSQYYSTFAHEFTHGWQYEQKLYNQTLLNKEGFAEWIAFKTLQKFKFHKEIKNFGNREDVYGKGFRKFRRFEKKYGDKQLVVKVKRL